jgi:hypothetical protein
MATSVTYHKTEEAEVLFMNAAKPLKNKFSDKEEYAIKLKFLEGSKTIQHLMEVAESKVDTKINRKLAAEKPISWHISFSSIYPPVVLDADENKLSDKEIPFFDGRKDKARALVAYKVIHYPNARLVRLQGIKLVSLDLAPREEFKPTDKILEEIKQFLN